jgi:type IV pilus assembly protein PilO
MLRQLPGETEVPSLLVDISQTGLAAGLEERLFQPMNEVSREAYSELPIRMQWSAPTTSSATSSAASWRCRGS